MPEQTSQEDQEQQEKTPVAPVKDPVRKWTFIVLGLCIVLIALYLVADRATPFTSQARVHAFVVPIAPQVAGNVISVEVLNNDQVTAGQPLFRIDTVFTLTATPSWSVSKTCTQPGEPRCANGAA